MFVTARWILAACCAATLLAGCAATGDVPATDADEGAAWSMATYPMVLLKAGPRRSEPLDDAESARLQAAHLAHITSMAEAGHLLLAGPMLERPGDDPIIGILLFRPGHEEAAQTLPADDPLVKAGRLRAEYLRWYGPAGLTYIGDPGPLDDVVSGG